MSAKVATRTVLVHAPGGPVRYLAGEEIPEEHLKYVGDHVFREVEDVLKDPADDLESMTVPKLNKFARDNNIDLGGASRKEDIINKIRAADG